MKCLVSKVSFLHQGVLVPCLLILLFSCLDATALVVYVDNNAAGANNGSSWADAFTTIQPAVDAAFAAGGGEVWVAEGTYGEVRANATGSLEMRAGVHLYGGFSGGETVREQRDYAIHLSVIDGSSARAGNPAYHVVIAAEDATLDGFTVQGGHTAPQSTADPDYNASGAGILVDNCSPLIQHCRFTNNFAERIGGGVFILHASAAQFIDCTFESNRSEWRGGAAFIHRYGSTAPLVPQFEGCQFLSNSVGSAAFTGGSAIKAEQLTDVDIFSCRFEDNFSGPNTVTLENTHSRVTNCIFVGNLTGSALDISGPNTTDVVNNTFFNNTGYAISANQGINAISNCIIWANGNSIQALSAPAPIAVYSDIQGGYSGTGNIDADPLFANASSDDFHLSPGSPCIDSGTSEGAPTVDILGSPRPQGGGYDMGAYEGNGEFNWVEIDPAAEWSPRYEHEMLTFSGSMWVIGGATAAGKVNDVQRSLDGITWSGGVTNLPASACASSVVHDGKMWRIGGLGGPSELWYSSDGMNWSKVPTNPPWTGRVHHATLVFGEEMWLLGGDIAPGTPEISTGLVNDVWHSADGANWLCAATNPDWLPRRSFSVAEFHGKIWVIGGETSGGRVNDVWSSDNGIDWDLVTDSAAWTPRNDHSTVVYDNKLWVLGGFDGGACNDVWCSSDGAIWTRVISPDQWSPRYGQACTVFSNRIWVTGGRDEADNHLHDVWASVGKVLGKKGYEYRYDTVSRLTAINPNNGVHIAYDYDPAGNRLQKRVYSDLEVTAGPANPSSGGVANNAVDRPMLQLSLSCAAADTVTLQSLSLATSGTGNEASAIAGAKLWLDVNGDGAVDGGDIQLGSAITISQDNGPLVFNTLNRTLTTGSPVYLLVSYTLNGTAGQGQSFALSLASPSDIVARFSDTGQIITPLGSSVAGATLTISDDTIVPGFAGLSSVTSGSSMATLAWEAATDPSTPITYSIWMASGSFGGIVSGEPNFQTTDTTFVVPNLANGQEYFFVVRAQDAAGNREMNTVEYSAIPESILYTLTVTSGPNGAVYGANELPYAEGMAVSLDALPDWGYVFTGWTGDVPAGQETANPLSLVMDSDKTLSATFARSTGTVVVNVNAAGAPWSLQDGNGVLHTGTGPTTLTSIPTGTVSLEWQSLAGHQVPGNPEAQTLSAGGAVIFSGAYAPMVHFGLPLPDLRLYTGDTLLLQAGAGGGLGQLHYQWLFTPLGKAGPVPIGGDVDTLTLPGVTTGQAGSYLCEVTDSTSVPYATNTALVQVQDHLTITLPPQGASLVAGNEYTLTVETAGGYEPLTYQWKKDGDVLLDEDAAMLAFTPINVDRAGSYTVVVSDSNGDSIESDPAVLTVEPGLSLSTRASQIGLVSLIFLVFLSLYSRNTMVRGS